jgi:hypothetical protein
MTFLLGFFQRFAGLASKPGQEQQWGHILGPQPVKKGIQAHAEETAS